MKKTTNYNLSLYEKTDKMTITAETDSLNHNMVLIDSVLKTKTTIDDVANYISEHEEDLVNAVIEALPSSEGVSY